MSNYLPTNCPNCGGILENGKCPYCGTSVMLANSVNVMDYGACDITLLFKQNDTVIILPLTGRIETITRQINGPEAYSYRNSSGLLERNIISCPDSVEFTFSGYVKENRQ